MSSENLDQADFEGRNFAMPNRRRKPKQLVDLWDRLT